MNKENDLLKEFWYLRNVIVDKFIDDLHLFKKNQNNFLLINKVTLFFNEKNNSIIAEISVNKKIIAIVKEFQISEHSIFERFYLLKDFINKTEIYFDNWKKEKKNYIIDFWKDGSKTKKYPSHYVSYLEYVPRVFQGL